MRAILFDLDGTLLDLDLQAFLGNYFSALECATRAALGPESGGDAFMQALRTATSQMMIPHLGQTNRSVFFAEMLRMTGINLDAKWAVFDAFYSETFPGLGGQTRPARGAREAVETALALGLRVAVATNPIFPREAIDHRITWAGLSDLPFDVITSFEFMESCKPHAAYFAQTASLLGVHPSECMMVGDDRLLDMPAADIGMRTFYVGPEPCTSATLQGDLTVLAELLPRLVAPQAEPDWLR